MLVNSVTVFIFKHYVGLTVLHGSCVVLISQQFRFRVFIFDRKQPFTFVSVSAENNFFVFGELSFSAECEKLIFGRSLYMTLSLIAFQILLWIRIRLKFGHVTSAAIKSKKNMVFSIRTVEKALKCESEVATWVLTSCPVCDVIRHRKRITAKLTEIVYVKPVYGATKGHLTPVRTLRLLSRSRTSFPIYNAPQRTFLKFTEMNAKYPDLDAKFPSVE